MSQNLLAAPADEEEKEAAPKTKKVMQTSNEWERLNTQNAIWLRDPSDVTDEEYEKFYQAMSKVAHPHAPPPAQQPVFEGAALCKSPLVAQKSYQICMWKASGTCRTISTLG